MGADDKRRMPMAPLWLCLVVTLENLWSFAQAFDLCNRDGFAMRGARGSSGAETAAEPMPVFWVYADYEGHWCLRKEGGGIEAEFTTRAAAIARLHELVGEASSYRAFIAKTDGRMIEEMRNLGGALNPPSATPIG